MAKKKDPLAALHLDMKLHPEKYDFGDVPEGRVKIPEQEARYDAAEPEWFKKMISKSIPPREF